MEPARATMKTWAIERRAPGGVRVRFEGYLTADEAALAVREFLAALETPGEVTWDLRAMQGYDPAAFVAWQAAMRARRGNIRALRVVGGNVVVRTGARLLAGVLETPVHFVEAPGDEPAVAEPLSLSEELRSEGALVLTSDDLIVSAFYRSQPVATLLEFERRCLRHVERIGRPVARVALVHPSIDTRNIDDAYRTEAARLDRVLAPKSYANVTWIAAEGFVGALQRAIVQGVRVLSDVKTPSLVARDAEEVARFLVTLRANRRSYDALLGLLLEARRRADEAVTRGASAR